MKLLLPGIPAAPATRAALTTSPATSAAELAPTPPEPDIRRFLYNRVEVKHRHEVPARMRASLPFIKPKAVEAAPDDVVELEFEGGFRQWISVEQLQLDMAAAGVRSAEDGVPVPMQPITLRPQRSRGVTEWVLKGLKVLGVSPVDAAADWAEAKVISSFEEDLNPRPGLYPLETPLSTGSLIENPGAFGDGGQPALLFIHGTASSISGSFSGLGEEKTWADLRGHYGDRIFGFQHKTLSVSPVTNALELARLLPNDTRLHLVSHSRGGLVGELLCLNELTGKHLDAFDKKAKSRDAKVPAEERDAREESRRTEIAALQELADLLAEKQFKIERFARVACPARGTILASGRLDLYLSLFTSAVGLLVDKVPALGPVHDFAAAAVIEIARRRTRPEGLPGFEAQMPESPLIHLLNQTGLQSKGALGVIAGDIEGGNVFAGANLGKWLGVLATDLFYWEDHDLVVNTRSMDGGMGRADGVWQFFDQGAGVSHFNYFHNPRTRDRLLGWLRSPEGQLDPEFQKRARSAPQVARSVSRDAKAMAGFPALFILPGIMGTLLGDAPKDDEELGEKHILWLNQQRLALGGLQQLAAFEDASIVPLGPVQQNYGAIAAHFASAYEVVLFGYDWRRSVLDAGRALARAIEERVNAGRTVRLLAHSMGGLVARAMIAEHDELWEKVCAGGGRLIQLGTPNRGSYAIPRVLWGVDESVRMLDLLDPEPVDALCRIFARWPGVLEMLPEEPASEKNGEPRLEFGRFFDPEWWSKHRPEAAPAAEALTAARVAREKLNGASTKNTIYVAGIATETPAGLNFNGDGREPKWETTSEGDGTVPHVLGRLPGERLHVYYLDAIHGDLANHPAAFEAIGDLLAKGETNKLPATLTPGARAAAPRDTILRDDAPLLFPREEDLLAAALRSRPRRPVTRRPELPPLEVTVFHGDLRLSRHPVIVGHYLGDKIVHAEATLDEQLEGRLSHRWRLGLYTGAEGEADPVLAPECQPPGAIVVGLGEVGALSARKIERGVRNAALRYGMHLFDQHNAAQRVSTKLPPAGLSVLLLGTNGGTTLRIIDSVTAIIAGVREANRLLCETLPPERRVCIGALHIIELYETLAIRALYAAQRAGERLSAERSGDSPDSSQAVHVAPYLQSLGPGRFQPSLDELDTGWWPRIIITGERDAAGQATGHLRFAVVSDRSAGIEERITHSQARNIESFIQRGITSPNFNIASAAGLFELLVPKPLKVRLDSDADNLVLLLDQDTARVPWEMLARRSASEDGRALDHLALRLGMLRQFKTAAMSSQQQPSSRSLKAVVIGDTESGFAELPGAQEEAKEVAALFTRRGVAVSTLLRGDADAVTDAILAPDYRILHIAAHGDYQPVPERSGVVLGTGRFFSPLEVEAMPAMPELVFINCCHLGLMSPNPDAPLVSDEDFAEHLVRISQSNNLAASLAVALINKGVKAVVAAGWAVDDSAARTFATAFYDAMLSGECFGDSVLRARKATAAAHANVNTWCAYQCYGSPDFRLEIERDGGAAVGARRSRGEFPYVSRTEFLHAIRELPLEGAAGRKSLSQKRRGELAERLEKLAAAIPPHWRDGKLLYELGLACAALKQFERAVFYLEASMRDNGGLAPFRAAEQLSNFEDRIAAARAGTATDAVGAEIRELWQKAGQRLDELIALAKTRERFSLRGAIAKRQAFFEEGETHRALLAKAADGYGRADLLARAAEEIDPYPALNALTCQLLLLNEHDGEKRAALRRELQTVQEAIEKRLLLLHSDVWSRVHRADALLLQHLIEGTLHHDGDGSHPSPREAVITEYRRVFDGGAFAHESDSVRGQIRFLIRCLQKPAATFPERAAVIPVLEEIDNFIASRG